MAITISNPGQALNQGDRLALYLKVFSGETIEAFDRASKVLNNHITRTIEHGKSAQFPIFGRAEAHYLKPGDSLDDLRKAIPHNERVITIDGLLTADQLITDLDDVMSHVDSRQVYAKQLGEALALSADGAVVAEVAKMVKEQKENAEGLGKGILLEETVKAGKKGITEEYGRAVVRSLITLRAKFSENHVPVDERYVYMTPTACASLISSMVAINKDFGAVATIVDGNIDRLCGFKVIEVPHLTAGGADKTGMIGTSPEGHEFPAEYKDDVAFVACHRTAVGTLKLKDISFENARRPEYQANQIIAKYAMGHGGLRPEASAVCLVKVGE